VHSIFFLFATKSVAVIFHWIADHFGQSNLHRLLVIANNGEIMNICCSYFGVIYLVVKTNLKQLPPLGTG